MDRQEARGRRSEVSDQPMSATADDRHADMFGDEFRGRSDGDRRAMRQEKSKPLVLALKAWLEQQLTRVSGKATIAEDGQSTRVASSCCHN
jgi:hypothetical protein